MSATFFGHEFITPPLVEFLLARIAEDEAEARGHMCFCEEEQMRHENACPKKILAECNAKRRIIAEHAPSASRRWCFVCTVDVPPPNNPAPYPCTTLRVLALPYASHAEFRSEWNTRPIPPAVGEAL